MGRTLSKFAWAAAFRPNYKKGCAADEGPREAQSVRTTEMSAKNATGSHRLQESFRVQGDYFNSFSMIAHLAHGDTPAIASLCH